MIFLVYFSLINQVIFFMIFSLLKYSSSMLKSFQQLSCRNTEDPLRYARIIVTTSLLCGAAGSLTSVGQAGRNVKVVESLRQFMSTCKN